MITFLYSLSDLAIVHMLGGKRLHVTTVKPRCATAAV
jgi:hypothetical protein